MTKPGRGPGTSLVYLGQGFSFAAVVGLLTLAGYKLDEWLGTGPWLLIVFALAGIAIATWDLIRTVNAVERRRGDRDA